MAPDSLWPKEWHPYKVESTPLPIESPFRVWVNDSFWNGSRIYIASVRNNQWPLRDMDDITNVDDFVTHWRELSPTPSKPKS